MPTLPTFVIIGAPRAGTTTLHHYLDLHPQVAMSAEKEPNYFSSVTEPAPFAGPFLDRLTHRNVRSLDAYRALFRDAGEARAVGEASTQYLYSAAAAEAMRATLPDVKIVAILRDPVQRAHSSFLHMKADGLEPLDTFEAALAAEPERIAQRWWPAYYYRAKGLYHAQLAAYAARFPARDLRIYLYEDLRADAAGLLDDLFGFLGVDRTLDLPAPAVTNASGVPRNRHLQRFLQAQGPLKRIVRAVVPRPLAERVYFGLQSRNLAKPPLDEGTRDRLAESYRDDVRALQGFLGRDLSHWLG